jgi:quinol monooxygenase YgiN
MVTIVAGKLMIKPGLRDEFIEKSREAIMQARENEFCDDFSVSPDPVESDRVNIFENWKSRSALDAFRNAGPESDIFLLVEAIDVNEYEIDT